MRDNSTLRNGFNILAGKGVSVFGFAAVLACFGMAQHRQISFQRLTSEDGLSQNTANAIVQDKQGFIWIGTEDGLNRFNGYEIEVFRNDPENPNTLINNTVESLLVDSEGMLWVGTNGGLTCMDPASGAMTHFRHDEADADSLSGNKVWVIFQDSKKRIWVGTDQGGLNLMKPDRSGFLKASPDAGALTRDGHAHIRDILEDEDGILWVATGSGLFRLDPATLQMQFMSLGEDESQLDDPAAIMDLTWGDGGHLWLSTNGRGLIRYHPESKSILEIHHREGDPLSLSENHLRQTLIDPEGQLWIATRSSGICLYDRDKSLFERFSHTIYQPGSIGNNRIQALMVDRGGVLWIGTNGGGVHWLDLNNLEFKHYLYLVQDDAERTKSRTFTKAIFEDRFGVLWVGTLGGLLEFDRAQNRMTTYNHDPADPTSISHEEVWAVFEDSANRLWVGTNGGGLNLFDRRRRQFKAYRSDPDDPTTLGSDRIRTLNEDREGRFWVGTLDGGLNLFDRETGEVKRFLHDPQDPESISNDRVRAFYQDPDGAVWIGTLKGGLNRLDPATGKFKRYLHDKDKADFLSDPGVLTICPDDEGYLWLGTYGGGLNRFDPSTETFRIYRNEHGLPNEVIYGILRNGDHLWLSTNRGLSRFNTYTEEFRNFDIDDGLQGNEFNTGAYFKSQSGELFFGGINGFNAFYPDRVVDNLIPPNVVLTAFKKLGGQMQLERQPIDPEGLTLSYKDTVFSIEFAALDFAQPTNNKFRYKMVGFQDQWIPLENRRDMTFTNLDAGHYEFHVKAANSDGIWNDEGTSIPITIVPPIWKTTWAYTLYVLAILTGIWWYVRSQRQKLAKERSISERLRTVDRLKDEFLANTSHELRTPLNGIIGLTQSLLDGAAGPVGSQLATNLTKVVYSGKRLAGLVNDILDFSKLKNQSLRLDLKPVNVHAITEVIFDLSRPLIGPKDLNLVNEISPEAKAVMADENRLHQIMSNLIGNAIKFTESGQVLVRSKSVGDMTQVDVVDTGIGIPRDQWDRIFKSFEQADGSSERHYGGTGLGLAITRKLVELHGGSIWVTSEEGKGSVFSFRLPSAERQASEAPATVPSAEARTEVLPDAPVAALTEALPEVPSSALVHQPEPAVKHSGEFNVLIVDDEPVNRQVLINYLSLQNYRLIEAANGPEALKILQENDGIDLVLLDIMMPKMSGFQVCREIRKHAGFQELPVIFLTAKNQIGDLVTGFECGANDYLTKPINREELLSRVKTHLQLLDINRNLEKKVEERTFELAEKNHELGEKNRAILRTQKQLIMQEKMASMGTLTAGIAHEIKNPLHFVNNFSEMSMEISKELREHLLPQKARLEIGEYETLQELSGDLEQNTGIIYQHGKRANQIVQSMMELARGATGERAMTDVNHLVEKFTQLAYHGTQAKERWLPVSIQMELDPEVGRVELEAQNMSRVIINLIRNALEALSEKQAQAGDDFEPVLQVRTVDQNDSVLIVVRDNGPGIQDEHLGKIFDPFFTTKATGGDHIGLGLSMSYEIVVQEHHGHLDINTKPGEFTSVTVTLPKDAFRQD